MVREVVDRNSGAILFKKDPDTLRYEEIVSLLREYEERIAKLEEEIKFLKNSE